MSDLEVLYYPPNQRGKKVKPGRFLLTERGKPLALAEIELGYGVEPWQLWALLSAMVGRHNALVASDEKYAADITLHATLLHEAMVADPLMKVSA